MNDDLRLKKLIGEEGMLGVVFPDDISKLAALSSLLCTTVEEGEDDTLKGAIYALGHYRMRLRRREAEAMDFPVRKAVPGTRYWWRAVTAAGHVIATQKEGNEGSVQVARRYAREAYVKGISITELIPPDIDPTGVDERQKNRSGYQPDGLNVAQRAKKH